MRPAGSAAAASATPVQSSICRLVAATASLLMSESRVLLAKVERTAVASTSAPPESDHANAIFKTGSRLVPSPREALDPGLTDNL
jgi:hypothetical protein